MHTHTHTHTHTSRNVRTHKPALPTRMSTYVSCRHVILVQILWRVMEHNGVVPQAKRISETYLSVKKVSKRKKKLPGRKQRLLRELQEDLKTQAKPRIAKKKACDRPSTTAGSTNPIAIRLVGFNFKIRIYVASYITYSSHQPL